VGLDVNRASADKGRISSLRPINLRSAREIDALSLLPKASVPVLLSGTGEVDALHGPQYCNIYVYFV